MHRDCAVHRNRKIPETCVVALGIRLQVRELSEVVHHGQVARKLEFPQQGFSPIIETIQNLAHFLAPGGPFSCGGVVRHGTIHLSLDGIFLTSQTVHHQGHMRAQSRQQRINDFLEEPARQLFFSGVQKSAAPAGSGVRHPCPSSMPHRMHNDHGRLIGS